MRIDLLFISIFLLHHTVYGQEGGNQIFSFLNLSPSSRTTALGGSQIVQAGVDISTSFENPATSNAGLDNELSFQHQFLFAGIQTGQVGYGRFLATKNLMLHGGAKYILFGEFDGTDVFGNQTGTFKGSEAALYVGASYQLYENLSVGANLKFINSSLDVYRSSALAIDLGAIYNDTSGLFSAGFSIRNAGIQISTFDDLRENLPLEMSIGITRKLKHLPFRLFITYHHLQRWNLLYDDPNTQEGGFFGGFQTIDSEPSELDNFFRHLIFGGEFILGKNEAFKVRFGYDHQRKQELSLTNFRTLTGFSLGFGFRVKKLRFDYAISKVHFGGSTHHLGLSTNLKTFTSPQILN